MLTFLNDYYFCVGHTVQTASIPFCRDLFICNCYTMYLFQSTKNVNSSHFVKL